MRRNTFPKHLQQLLEKCKIHGSLRSGFQKTGLFPFSPDVIRGTVPAKKVTGSTVEVPPTENQARATIAVEAFQELFLKSIPEKKRKEKDARLDTTNGLILNTKEFYEALKDRQKNMKHKRALKPLNSPKKAKGSCRGVVKKISAKAVNPCEKVTKDSLKTAAKKAPEKPSKKAVKSSEKVINSTPAKVSKKGPGKPTKKCLNVKPKVNPKIAARP